jgi:hypothetical protein
LAGQLGRFASSLTGRTYRMSRDTIEKSIADQGFQMYRMKPKEPAAS